MQRLASKGASQKDLKTHKLIANTSRGKKDSKQSSTKNIKTVKGIIGKGQFTEETKIGQTTSPDSGIRGREVTNDYGVNTFYANYKVKNSHKKESEEPGSNSDYCNFNSSRDAMNNSQYDLQPERTARGLNIKVDDSDYSEAAFHKIKLPSNRGLINANGKFITAGKVKEQKNLSFHNSSANKHSFSLNFASRDQSRYRKKGKSKSKSKKQLLEEPKSFDCKVKSKSADKTHLKDSRCQSYYQKSRHEKRKDQKVKCERKEKKNEQKTMHSIEKGVSITSKATSAGTETQKYQVLCLTQDTSFVEAIKDEITASIDSAQLSCAIRSSKLSDVVLKERGRCLAMISRICGALNIKREAFFLATLYLDRFITQFPYQSMKLISLGCLSLSLKMDDAEMVSKFCFHYLYNPERTVKKNRSSHQIKLKQKRQRQRESVVGREEVKSRLTGIINAKISQERRSVKEDFSLEEVLEVETQIMLQFGFKLVAKTLGYWVDMLTALWDSYVGEFCPKYADTLIFRNQKTPRNISYVIGMLQLESLSMRVYKHSKVSLVLAAIYLVTRMALQQKKEETPWEDICRFYQTSLSKTTNLIFCDGVGINVLFGDFLTLLELSMANIIDCVQLFSRHLQPNLIRPLDYRRVEGHNREDKLATHLHCQQLYKTQLLL